MTETPAARRGSAPNKSLRRKSAARLSAIRSLYAQHFAGEQAEVTIDAWADAILAQEQASITENDDETALTDAPERALLVTLLEAERMNRTTIDKHIRDSMGEKWTAERLGPLLESILRIAIAEIIVKHERSPNIIINEYVGLTQAYFDDSEVGFINGILANIAKKLRE